ncbi:MAG: U32 family peptidase [Lachnospiraceae bacterium]|nr:U32 family peptidase [Lachnospiraceae bacterium]
MKKVELLAPAGNYEAMIGAFTAGADAVYLGGSAFGARAYADNFTEEEIIKGIHYAHMLGKKVYLTVNTLVKEKEFPLLYEFLLPFYINGLDGVIIQDVGVFQYIKKQFPGMELHVSTQMTITGVHGARLLKEEGAVRIVPARELSLNEIREIKQKVDIEIEAFIHGAMCYCYSGQCLFSSILGGRSGNRGRCAQPCRLPYQINKGEEQYPLSMKDMCTLTLIPELIQAGIDSFKIEGRMKKPEYAAGVTALYRKYIDLYYNNPKDYTVANEDIAYLKKLYIRSDIQEGYYHRHNGKDMITLKSPAYVGSDDELLQSIREQYLNHKPQISVDMSAVLLKNQPASMTLTYDNISVTVHGDIVQQALKQPLSKEKIKEQLSKSGNTVFIADDILLVADTDIFMPVSALNRLRRDAFEVLEKAIRAEYQRNMPVKLTDSKEKEVAKKKIDEREAAGKDAAEQLHVLVRTREQLEAAVKYNVSRIYVEGDLIDDAFLIWLKELQSRYKGELYLAFPHIVRKNCEAFTDMLYEALCSPLFRGALVRNLETISFLSEKKNSKPIVTDCNLYACNKEALSFYGNVADEVCLPLELNKHEYQEMFAEAEIRKTTFPQMSALVYGRIPMMITANCLKKTSDCCDKKPGYVTLTDRYRKEFPVYTNCSCCYNVIYNSVPLSLHKLFEEKKLLGNLDACRLDFTIESGKETAELINYFMGLYHKYKEPSYTEFTTGHLKRGVE